jgi:hypothetical protein
MRRLVVTMLIAAFAALGWGIGTAGAAVVDAHALCVRLMVLNANHAGGHLDKAVEATHCSAPPPLPLAEPSWS